MHVDFWNKERDYVLLCFCSFYSCCINLNYEWNSLFKRKNIFHSFKTYKKTDLIFLLSKTPFLFYHKTDLIFLLSKTIFLVLKKKTDLILFQIKKTLFLWDKHRSKFLSPKNLLFFFSTKTNLNFVKTKEEILFINKFVWFNFWCLMFNISFMSCI